MIVEAGEQRVRAIVHAYVRVHDVRQRALAMPRKGALNRHRRSAQAGDRVSPLEGRVEDAADGRWPNHRALRQDGCTGRDCP